MVIGWVLLSLSTFSGVVAGFASVRIPLTLSKTLEIKWAGSDFDKIAVVIDYVREASKNFLVRNAYI
jgi:hypothetical protein